jgi:hypothetical protein
MLMRGSKGKGNEEDVGEKDGEKKMVFFVGGEREITRK